MAVFLPTFVGIGSAMLILTIALFVLALISSLISRSFVKKSKHSISTEWLGIAGLWIVLGGLVIVLAFPFFTIVITALAAAGAILSIIVAVLLIIAIVKLFSMMFR